MSSILWEEDDGVVLLTLNRPGVKNAVDDSMMAGLEAVVARLAGTDGLVAVLLTAAGSDGFCSGGDLTWLQGLDTPEKGQAMARRMQSVLRGLSELPVPVIAVLNGYALGGGAEIALAADMRIMESHAYLCFKQARVGLMTGWGGGGRLLRLVGYARAFELLTTCPKLGPADARAMGLVNWEAPSGEGLRVAREICASLRRASPASVRVAKAFLSRAMGHGLDAAREIESDLFGDVWMSADHQEALAAFSQKRPPRFR